MSPIAYAAPGWAAATPPSFADLIDTVSPAVVQITTSTSASANKAPRGGGDPLDQLPPQFREGPLRDFFDRFFRDDAPGRPAPPMGPRSALGSGFVIGADGLIVTNNHVVGEANDIKVKLKDGRELPATLIGSDEKTDLAVLRIKPESPLPAVAWGDSDAARVGDWVIAVGNPFGLGGTVTAGIISSRGRDLGAGPYDDFIQIDAPLNSGNSGGPLFNGEGKVIGVNTAIFSPTGGSVGIGFAIPSDLAKKVVAELAEKGSVQRGWLGVAIQPVTQEIADSLGLKSPKGALVAEVTADSPAAKAGVRQGDVILAFGDKQIGEVRDLTRAVAEVKSGERKSITVWRGEREVSMKAQIGEAPKPAAAAAAEPRSLDLFKEGVALGPLGLTVAPLDNVARERFGLGGEVAGVVVSQVEPDKNAAEKGVRVGDVIMRANDTEVAKPEDLASVVARAQESSRKAVLLLVQRGAEKRFVAVSLAAAS